MNKILAPGIFCGPGIYPHYVAHHGIKMLEQSVRDSFETRVDNLKKIVQTHPNLELVGHSAGASVVLRVAHDMRVKGVILISPVPMPGCWLPPSVNLALTSYLRLESCKVSIRHSRKYFFNVAAHDNIHHLVYESPKVIWKLAWHQIARHRRSEFIPLSGTPIRVLVGDLDLATPVACVKRTAEILGVTEEILPGFGHMPFLEDRHFADRFNLRPRTAMPVSP